MAPPKVRTVGRPRGSGSVASIGGIEFTADEAAPFFAGMRVYLEHPELFSDQPPGLADFSPYLTLAERQALKRSGNRFFINWLTVGLMYGCFERALQEARGQ